jgi:hypothetical protein
MLHAATLKIISAIVAKSRTDFYSVQCFMQLVSQRFAPLQGMLNGAMTRATCLATPLQLQLGDKLHDKLHRVTGSYFYSEYIRLDELSAHSLNAGRTQSSGGRISKKGTQFTRTCQTSLTIFLNQYHKPSGYIH